MRTFLRFLKPYRGLCLLTLLVMALDVAGALYLPTIVADMINIGVAGGDLDFILRKGGLMLGVALVSGGGTLMGCFLCARLSARIGRDMRNALYDKSLTFSASDFEGFGTGSMITRTLNDVNVVQQAFVWSVQMVLPVPLMCVIGVLMAFSIDHVMGLLLIGITLVVILGAVLVTRRASAIFARAQRFLDRISVVVRENITGARVIRAFNKATGEAGRMRRSFTDYAQAAIQANTLFFVLESLAIFFLNLCVVAILWLGGNRIGGGFMEIGDITALTEYAVLILFYVMMAQMVLMLLPRAKVCLERIDAVLSHRPEITDGAGSLPQTEGEAVCAFQHAWFRFADADEATLQDLDFVLRRGQTTAIIGSTGSGKSTLVNLIPRFYDVTEGEILLDGVDIRQVSQHDLRARIGYVPQKGVLFSGTIASNLKYGRPDMADGEMEQAARIAQAEDFITAKPDGYEAEIAQGGTNVSGGQKQRLSIARAIAVNPEVYIFDDSFSALDYKTDVTLRKALQQVTAESTVIIVAQRISTILHAEQIIVLDEGNVAGIGTHQELMESCEVYQQIALSQLSKEELAQ